MNGRKTALVCGMAKSGVASARLLWEQGYQVTINDMKKEIPGLKEQLAGIEYTDALGQDPMELVAGQDLVVLSPVIPIFAPFAKKAKALGAEVIGEIELGYRYCDPKARFVCVSGTNGKTTTTALTGALFQGAGKRAFVLGNIGVPITQEAKNTRPGDYVVAEVAALQLESIKRFRPNAMGMLNISEDHLNRFENRMENYVAAKCRAFENQRPEDFAVLNYDDPVVRDMARLTKARVVYFSQAQALGEGMCLQDGRMTFRLDGREIPLVRPEELQIPGAHNLENAMCAATLALCMGLEPAAVCRGLKAFPGVEHRIEFVREVGGVRYINDSKGTNTNAAIVALNAMTKPVILIAGGYDKKEDYNEFIEVVRKKVKRMVLVGATASQIEETAESQGYYNTVRVGDYDEAVKVASECAAPGDVVLLSPACASWDMFDNFEIRGQVFKDLVKRIGSN